MKAIARDIVRAVPQRLAITIETKPRKVSMLWTVLSDRDEANQLLRSTIKALARLL